MDRLWQWIAETVFVRFEFDFPTDKLLERVETGKLVFAMVDGGLIDWFILSSWCRSQGLGPVQIANRKRILFFSSPTGLFKRIFRRTKYADLLLQPGAFPRLLILSGRERKKISVPTPTETILSDMYGHLSAQGALGSIALVPVFILWKRHVRGGSRAPSEYLFGLSSKPNTLGKIWFLLRRRTDSKVTALGFLPLASKESLEKLEGFDENEAMRAAKSARRKVLVWVQQEMRVLLGPRYHSPSLIKETVLRDPEIQALITRLAEEQGVDRKKLMSQAYQNLTEIVSDYRFRVIEVVYALLTWLFAKVFDGLNAKDEEWQQVREIMKTRPVAFVPCHRSHLDYLVIPYLMFQHDMVTPHVAAGINLSFWPVGPLLRMGGAFFIRRTFRGNPLYHAIITKYVQTLLKNRYNVKFFIEGTRSRSGKMLAPAYGMLKMVMEAHASGVCDDIVLIPVSICYDEVPEQGSYTKEIGGGQKVAESAMELIKSRKIIRGRFGAVYVRLATPISVKEVYHGPETDPRRRLQKTAFQVCKSICDNTPITPKSMVSMVLLCHRNPLLTLEEVLRLTLRLAEYVQHAQMELSVSDKEDFRRSVELTLRRLRKSGVLLEIENVPRRYVCDSRKRTTLNFYKNNALHCFVVPGIAMLAYYRAWHSYRAGADFEELFKNEALALRDILKFEFFFKPRQEFLAELDHSASFFFGDVKAGYPSPEKWGKALSQVFPVASDVSVVSRVTGELLESYLVFTDFVRGAQETVWERKAMLSKAFRFAEARQQQGDILFPESLSMVTYANVLSYLENQGVVEIDKDDEKTTVRKVTTGRSIDSIVQQLTDLRDLLQEREEAFFEKSV